MDALNATRHERVHDEVEKHLLVRLYQLCEDEKHLTKMAMLCDCTMGDIQAIMLNVTEVMSLRLKRKVVQS